MQMRTLCALAATGLLYVPGIVQAEGEATNVDSPTPSPSFAIKIMPNEAWVAPGASATFSVMAESRAETLLHLAARTPDGVTATLSSTEMDVAPGAYGKVTLTLTAPTSANRTPYKIVVIAKDDAGNEREARAALHMREIAKPATKPEPRPETRPSERPVEKPVDLPAYEKRADALERRLIALLERIERALGRAEDPAERPEPKPEATIIRMTLADEHAIVGAERGRVALLFEGGERDARVQLAARYNESGGWKVAFEKDQVFVPANQRAWIWVYLNPGNEAALEYAIVQVDTPGPYLAKGMATARTP